MKKSILLITLLLLAACSSPQKIVADAASKCPQIGIDINAPDFYQKHKLAEIDTFYGCMETQLKPGFIMPFGSQGGLIQTIQHDDRYKASLQTALEYQHNLWRGVLHKERKPSAASETWTLWVQNENKIEADKENAARIARAINDQTLEQNNAAAMQNAQMMQQNMQLQQIQQQQFIQNGMRGGR